MISVLIIFISSLLLVGIVSYHWGYSKGKSTSPISTNKKNIGFIRKNSQERGGL